MVVLIDLEATVEATGRQIFEKDGVNIWHFEGVRSLSLDTGWPRTNTCLLTKVRVPRTVHAANQVISAAMITAAL